MSSGSIDVVGKIALFGGTMSDSRIKRQLYGVSDSSTHHKHNYFCFTLRIENSFHCQLLSSHVKDKQNNQGTQNMYEDNTSLERL